MQSQANPNLTKVELFSRKLPPLIIRQLVYLFNERNGRIQPRYHVWQRRSGADIETPIQLTSTI